MTKRYDGICLTAIDNSFFVDLGFFKEYQREHEIDDMYKDIEMIILDLQSMLKLLQKLKKT